MTATPPHLSIVSPADADSAAGFSSRDPNAFPGIMAAIPLGLQHVLAMFVSNITPAIIVAAAAGIGYGSPDTSAMVYMIQMAMFFAGVATLLQTVSFGPVGARLPLVQGTSFSYVPIMVPLVAGKGPGALGMIAAAAFVAGLLHAVLSQFVGRIRFALPPLVTGLVVLMIALSLMKVAVQYAAGGVPLEGTPAYGSGISWLMAGCVVIVTMGFALFARGVWSSAAVLFGLIAGYVLALALGRVDFAAVHQAGWFTVPQPLHFGWAWSWTAVLGFCLTGFVSSIETIGDVDAICEGNAGRPASKRELQGAVAADGLGSALAALFGGMPNTTFSQNVGLVAITGVMSRHVVTIGALFLVACGLLPKVGAAIATIPIEVLGGGVIVMFGMVASAAVAMLAQVAWSQRNMLVFGISLSLGLGLQLEPTALQHLPETARILLTSGILPAATLAVVLNLLLPRERKGQE
ncbi:uracil-xanthine permease family protein [Novosphingobium sp. 9]|uniref:uracil-xanthine permease family protein n=1 Tax=Novosphingobium sp. 9 TaxID=2025349 RepID=UPI0021B615C6|nr:nucleobase:cation symporter-2 family protein [Novosphingobium sp. 9]